MGFPDWTSAGQVRTRWPASSHYVDYGPSGDHHAPLLPSSIPDHPDHRILAARCRVRGDVRGQTRNAKALTSVTARDKAALSQHKQSADAEKPRWTKEETGD